MIVAPAKVEAREEATKATKEKRAAKPATELSAAEEERVNKEKENLKKLIKKDQARLEEVYPEAQKAKVKEAK